MNVTIGVMFDSGFKYATLILILISFIKKICEWKCVIWSTHNFIVFVANFVTSRPKCVFLK